MVYFATPVSPGLDWLIRPLVPALLAVVPLVFNLQTPNCKFGDIQELCYGPFIFMSSVLPIERTGKPCGSLLRSPASIHFTSATHQPHGCRGHTACGLGSPCRLRHLWHRPCDTIPGSSFRSGSTCALPGYIHGTPHIFYALIFPK